MNYTGKTKQIFIASFTIIALLMFSGCISVKPQADKAGKNLYETFYVGEQGTQYFIKPLFFEDRNNRSQLYVDITFRYKNQVKDSATVNLSILSDKAIRELTSIGFYNQSRKIEIEKYELLFFQAKNNQIESRYSVKMPLKSAIIFYSGISLDIQIKSANKQMDFTPSAATQKNLVKLKKYVFELMNDK